MTVLWCSKYYCSYPCLPGSFSLLVKGVVKCRVKMSDWTLDFQVVGATDCPGNFGIQLQRVVSRDRNYKHLIFAVSNSREFENDLYFHFCLH